ncbi:respiratory nitrate reductase subunit gamma [Desulfitobacterium hafniense]|uniref:Nitrate reductase gamma chain n=3 Tax=Desulfitobacterium hafniense TaxID=49338 RepID=Q251B6_DESHY|nr:respiratory nitrate reductase subunit gamma [Desulfitobacterium hafniense]EHL08043.1 respiratory nitrate reductase, gamma subunit [Desulfitobacterium hafniense DP7]KTE91560.1 nitrate reductase [Desulfitobacterium hafniense]BAE82126.1 nitrate reductase gamma chain [Desulfitobacterium hafniense Y51]CDX00329.1 Nitrate reductase gamma chain NarI [Desulfitobacterium hafniense]
MMNQLLWVIFPYTMLTAFVVGHIYRYRSGQIGWTSRSSQLLEKKALKWGSTLFHFGVLAALCGHVGMLVPKEVMEAIGINEHMYHMAASWGGSTAGVITLIGTIILLLRRLCVKRIRRNSSMGDLFVIVLIAGIVFTGLWNSLVINSFGAGHDYRETVGPWLRGLITLQPRAELMGGVPLFFKLHILMAFAALGLWPFTRLVHVWSFPLTYLKRSRILYRKWNKAGGTEQERQNTPAA